MDDREYTQKDREYGSVYDAELALQHRCELAGTPTQAAQAREIRRQARTRLAALHGHRQRTPR